MMLIDEAMVPDAALPLEQFKAHLRLGTGFGDESLQDAVLTGFLRAALAAIEARTSKVMIQRATTWSLTRWQSAGGQDLPAAPVLAVNAVALVDRDGTETPLEVNDFVVSADAHRPRLKPVGAAFPSIPSGGTVRLVLEAGLATEWGGLPADLAQAVLLLASHYYEFRNETALGDGCMPFGVTSLIQRYRPLRVGFGGGQ